MNQRKTLFKGLVAAGLAVVLTSGIALASIGTGTVTATASLRLRSEASVQSATLAYAPYSSQVSILAEAAGGWYKVVYDGKEGYMSSEWLDVELTGDGSDAGADADADQEAEELRQGTVTADVLNVRSGPGTGYGKVGSLKKGATVSITGETNGWYAITAGSVKGYVSAEYIDLAPVGGSSNAPAVDEPPVADELEPQRGIVSTSALNVRSGPGTGYSRVALLSRGASVTVTGKSGSWYAITAGSIEGYVSAEYITILDGSNTSDGSVGAAAAAMAASLVGSPYVYGASGPSGFDCSGLLYYIYRQLGYSIARGSSSQYNQSGYFVSTSEMQPGDLVYFFDPRFDGSGGTLPTTHAGIYVGNNQFIHASTTSYRVQYDDLFGSYYEPYLVGVKRIA